MESRLCTTRIADENDQIELVLEVEMELVRCSWLFGLVSDDWLWCFGCSGRVETEFVLPMSTAYLFQVVPPVSGSTVTSRTSSKFPAFMRVSRQGSSVYGSRYLRSGESTEYIVGPSDPFASQHVSSATGQRICVGHGDQLAIPALPSRMAPFLPPPGG
jgi:hypothetical protein